MSTERRLFHTPLPEPGEEVVLDEAGRKHARVLRLAVGDAVVLFDGEAREADALVITAGDTLRCRIDAVRQVALPVPPVALVLGMPKGGKLDAAARMATEVGVAAIHLAETERVVAKLDAKRAASRVQRLERVVREAARQAERQDVPRIFAPAPLLSVCARASDEVPRFVCYARGAGQFGVRPRDLTEREMDRNHGPAAWVAVGPEGGFTLAEIDALAGLGWSPVRLGPTVLRAETAVPVALSLLIDRLRAG